MTPQEQARHILERGYAVFPECFSSDEVDVLRQAILERVASAKPEAYWAPENRSIGENIEVTPTGVALPKLLTDRPEIAPLVLKPEVVDTVRGVLGEDAQLELVGAVVTDRARPFFAWHVHIGGLPDSVYRREGWPEVAGAERVCTLLYLDDLDENTGPLLVYPRTAGDPTEPPFDPDEERWEGQVELMPEKGTVVALEQCVWHAARSMRRDGTRVFLMCYYRAASLPHAEWADPNLVRAAPANPLLASLLSETPAP